LGLRFSIRNSERSMRVLVPYQVLHDIKRKKKDKTKEKNDQVIGTKNLSYTSGD